jgi:hypothetical protein
MLSRAHIVLRVQVVVQVVAESAANHTGAKMAPAPAFMSS